ncbi:GNAT family N-acetyltransferase [Paenibacillus thalictri]|uniref:N-acetyltransferase n=1 Tax=Paenibacillus thalictri TaxID=2527873 RepID=A0A4Q9DG31_9BACL|nr:GNAT family N-acetyltransferase [Paenibacillus thalictri]TBL67779.1 N-acetyltransferase [Paenibacillus thalictri]
MDEFVPIKGEKVLLRLISILDCNEQYLNWLLDPEVNRYLETRWESQSIDQIKSFVFGMIKSEQNYLFAIIDSSSNKHIGNIKLGPINFNHRTADISYFIGDKSMWRKGLASEAISLVVKFAFSVGIYKIFAGLYESNIGSLKALQKCGFSVEAILKDKLVNTSNQRENHVILSITNIK